MFSIFLSVLAVVFQILYFNETGQAMGWLKKPTAIVIDAETGQPIEGAVVIAIWRKHSFKDAWFEGGTMIVARVEEAVSDMEGNIYIDDFWDWHLFEDRSPHLTIYKTGYVCWDQANIYINEYNAPERKDFNKDNRIARLKKWPEGFSFVGHGSFVNSVTQGDMHEAPKKLFRKAFDYERNYRVMERTERRKMRKEVDKQKKRRQK